MRARFLASSLVFAAASALSLLAQGKTADFSGQWIFDHGSGEVAVVEMPSGVRSQLKAPPVLGSEATIKQDAKALTLELTRTPPTMTIISADGSQRDGPQPPAIAYTLTYALDGSESKNKIPSSPTVSQDTTSKATWDGTTLVVMITNSLGRQSRRTFQIQPDGTLLVEHTPQPAGDPSLTVRSFYKKKPA